MLKTSTTGGRGGRSQKQRRKTKTFSQLFPLLVVAIFVLLAVAPPATDAALLQGEWVLPFGAVFFLIFINYNKYLLKYLI
jgi:uncharacterized integral membrane protein